MPIIAFLLGPIGRYLLIAVAVGGGFLWVKTHYENIGYAKAIADVAAQDQAAIDRVNTGKGDVAKCRAGGGTWSVVTGTCT